MSSVKEATFGGQKGDFIADMLATCQRCVDLLGTYGNGIEPHKTTLETILGELKRLKFTEIDLFKSFDLIILFMDNFFNWCSLFDNSARCGAGKELVLAAEKFFGLCIPHQHVLSLLDIVTFTRSDLRMLNTMCVPDSQEMKTTFASLYDQVQRYDNESEHIVSLVHLLAFMAKFNAWVAWLNREGKSGLSLRYRNRSIFPRLYYLLVYINTKV